MAEVALYSAHLTDYLATGGRVHYELWSHRFFGDDALFPGVIAFGLTIAALVSGVGWHRRARMAVAFGVVGCALSFGPGFPSTRWSPSSFRSWAAFAALPASVSSF